MYDYDKLAAGTLAGHILECGAQCTGGNFSNWEKVPNMDNIGYPIATVTDSTTFTISKDPNSGGIINRYTIIEQILYEMGNPKKYISPDVCGDFTSIKLNDKGDNRVGISNVVGSKATKTFKVSMS